MSRPQILPPRLPGPLEPLSPNEKEQRLLLSTQNVTPGKSGKYRWLCDHPSHLSFAAASPLALTGGRGRPLQEVVHAENAVHGLLHAVQLDAVDLVAELTNPVVDCREWSWRWRWRRGRRWALSRVACLFIKITRPLDHACMYDMPSLSPKQIRNARLHQHPGGALRVCFSTWSKLSCLARSQWSTVRCSASRMGQLHPTTTCKNWGALGRPPLRLLGLHLCGVLDM